MRKEKFNFLVLSILPQAMGIDKRFEGRGDVITGIKKLGGSAPSFSKGGEESVNHLDAGHYSPELAILLDASTTAPVR